MLEKILKQYLRLCVSIVLYNLNYLQSVLAADLLVCIHQDLPTAVSVGYLINHAITHCLCGSVCHAWRTLCPAVHRWHNTVIATHLYCAGWVKQLAATALVVCVWKSLGYILNSEWRGNTGEENDHKNDGFRPLNKWHTRLLSVWLTFRQVKLHIKFMACKLIL